MTSAITFKPPALVIRAPGAAARAHPVRVLASSSEAPASPSPRDATRAILEAEAPFIRGTEALEARVTYTSPLEAPWEGAGEMVSKTTQNSAVYTSTVPRESLVKV